MCLSQKHARERQCIVNTFFVYIFSRAFLLQLFSFSSSKFTLILLFCYLPARIISPSSTCPDLIKSVQDFCITTQLGISKSSIIWGKKVFQCFFFGASICSHRDDRSFWNLCPNFRKCSEAELVWEAAGCGADVGFRRKLARYSSREVAFSYQERCPILLNPSYNTS